MSHPTDDPLEEGASRLAQLASLAISSVETVVRLRSVRGRHASASDAAARDVDIDVDASSPELVVCEGQRLRETAEETPALAPTTAPRTRPREPSLGTSPTFQPPAAKTSALRAAPGATTPNDSSRSRRSTEELLDVHRDAQAFFRRGVEASWVPSYLSSRRLECALDERWGAGYAPAGWTALTDHLRRSGWDDEVLLASGISRRARTGNLIDHFRDRLVLPIYGHRDIVGFVGRCAENADERTPKYLNSPRTEIYDKATVLFGLNGQPGADWAASPTLVEGPLDAIAVTSSSNSFVGLATCGTALTPGHVTTMGHSFRLDQRLVVVATDSDPAGDAAAVKAYEVLAGRCHYLNRLILPEGQDPAGVLLAVGPEGLAEALSRSRVDLMKLVIEARLAGFGDQLQWVEGRVKAVRAVAPLLVPLPRFQREAAVHVLASRLDVLHTTVTEAVERAARARVRPVGPPAGPAGTETSRAQTSATPPAPAQSPSRPRAR